MATANQIAANRANARRSTGPRTSAGKAAAARNARKHALFAMEVVAAGEDAREFMAFEERLRGVLAPEGELEDALCARVVGCLWRLRRVMRLERAIVSREDVMYRKTLLERDWLQHNEADWLSLFSQYETRLDRMLHRALHELQRLQARRAGAHVPPPLVVDVDVHGLQSLEDPTEPMPAPSLRG
ncbi:MAG TPA: hypothetical protein VFV80_07500 [Geminicoccaceae bacterium]|nr:hypothetical protein [Geminicoccaceae bacterium]